MAKLRYLGWGDPFYWFPCQQFSDDKSYLLKVTLAATEITLVARDSKPVLEVSKVAWLLGLCPYGGTGLGLLPLLEVFFLFVCWQPVKLRAGHRRPQAKPGFPAEANCLQRGSSACRPQAGREALSNPSSQEMLIIFYVKGPSVFSGLTQKGLFISQ